MMPDFQVAQERAEYAGELITGARMRLSHRSSNELPDQAISDFVYRVTRAKRELDAAVDDLIAGRDKAAVARTQQKHSRSNLQRPPSAAIAKP